MRLFIPLVMTLLHLAMVSGRPDAEAVPEADANAEAEADADATADAQYQYGGPGMRRPYGGWAPGEMTRPYPPRYDAPEAADPYGAPEQPGRTYYGNPGDLGPYGSLPTTVEGNVLPLEGEPQVGDPSPSGLGRSVSYSNRMPSPPISYQPSPPISYEPSPPISYEPSQPVSYEPSSPVMYQQPSPQFYFKPSQPTYSKPPFYQPATTLPESVNIPSAPLVNNQNMMFTRSYTSIPGSPCMNVCRQRPTYNARPSCGTACNVRPACQLNRPMVDYMVSGNTLSCRPRPIYEQSQYSRPAYNPQPIMQDSGCGGGYSGYASGCGQSVGAVTLPESVYSFGGQGYNPGLNQGYNPGLNQGYNPGLNQGYNPGLNQGYNPGLPQGYNPGVPCFGNGCPGAQPSYQSTSAGCGAGGCSYQPPSTLPESLAMTAPGQVSAVTLPEKVSRAETAGNFKTGNTDDNTA